MPQAQGCAGAADVQDARMPQAHGCARAAAISPFIPAIQPFVGILDRIITQTSDQHQLKQPSICKTSAFPNSVHKLLNHGQAMIFKSLL